MTAPQMTESARRDLVVVDWACGVAKIMLEGNPADFGAAVRRGCEIAIAMSRRDIRAEVRAETIRDLREWVADIPRATGTVSDGDRMFNVGLDQALYAIDNAIHAHLAALLPDLRALLITTEEGNDD